MTVGAVPRKAGPTVGNSAATVFPFGFKTFLATDLLVQLTTIATGVVVTLVKDDPAGYTVALNADQNAAPGGTVTYNPLGVPLPATQTLTITSAMPQSQGTHLINGGSFLANNVEDMADRDMMATQDMNVKVAASLQFPAVDGVLNTTLPAAAQRANTTLGFDASGNVVVGGVATSIVSAAWQAVVQSATLALGRAAMGFSAYFDSLIGAANAAALRALFTPLTTKGDLWVRGATDTRQAVGADGQALQVDSSQGNGVVYIDNPSRPNLLTNPNWQIDQINEGALYTASGGTVSGPDGWAANATGTGVLKVRTLADPDNAALKCMEITCTTADASIAAGDLYIVYTAIEGYDTAALMAGTASAQAVTIQFKFKTSVTGVYGINVTNSAINRSYVGTITVADTSEHEYSVSLTMDTGGTWLYTNGVGLYMRLTLAGGSTYQTTAGSWQAGNFYTTAAQCNFMSVNTNIAYLKRIQLIPGALVQAYKPADIQKELAKCERYYAKTFPVGTAVAQSGGLAGALQAMGTDAAGGSVGGNNWQYPQRMRANPTVVTYNPSAANANWRDVTNAADRTVNVDQSGAASDRNVGLTASFVAASCINYIHATANARLV
jgi:hypothetical protein